jgi:hypothetical protein
MVRLACVLALSFATVACGNDSTSPPDASPPDAVPAAKLDVMVGAGGNVQSQDGAIDCGTACTHAYPLNTVVTLHAMPTTNLVFTGWSGACSGTADCTVTITANTTVTAAFACPPSTVFCD